MHLQLYQTIPEEARDIRVTVFQKEQGFVVEFDQIDWTAYHLVLFAEDGTPAGTCRFFPDSKGDYLLGRLAVLSQYRGKHYGEALVQAVEQWVQKEHPHSSVKLHAQCRMRGFYEKLGYTAFGQEDDDEGVPHIWMAKYFS